MLSTGTGITSIMHVSFIVVFFIEIVMLVLPVPTAKTFLLFTILMISLLLDERITSVTVEPRGDISYSISFSSPRSKDYEFSFSDIFSTPMGMTVISKGALKTLLYIDAVIIQVPNFFAVTSP